MQGQIAQLISSHAQADRQVVQNVFASGFQTMGHWRAFLRANLGDCVTQFRAPAFRWNVATFQALYVACWIHHPVEKGSYMIDLGGLSPSKRDVIKSAYASHCTGRKSSHLSGAGRSASKGWNFLKGYHELLIQFEETKGRPYLFLKAEGHTTGMSGIIPHMQSWIHKKKHGEGLQASAALNALSVTSPLVESRAAENYGKGYNKLLKDVLKLSGRNVTVREMMPALFKKTGYNKFTPAFTMTATNRQLGDALSRYCQEASHVGAGGVRYRNAGQITTEMVSDLRKLAGTLQSDGDVSLRRVYREIRLKPTEIDASLQVFYRSPVA